jgi:flavin-dependent dehydrogenase
VNTALNEPYDVIIIGGALSGAGTAVVLLKEQPRLRILIIEKTTTLSRRVGEATIEISTYYLTHSLGLMQFLNETQYVKQGLRYWFANKETENFGQCSEIGPKYQARVPAYLLDRATVDEEVLRRAVAMGAELWRPATVQKIDLVAGGMQRVAVRYQDKVETIEGRWVVDASGVAAVLARQHGWWRPMPEHPTTAVWSRWKGVKDWDGMELARKYPEYAKVCFASRNTATNHIMGEGWWAWMIPLKGGDVSVGVVFDQRMVTWAEDGSMGQRLKDFLMRHPIGRELMADAQWTEGDLHWRKNLAYYSTAFAGDGFALVGDAAGFLDPYYSPGLDWLSFTSTCTAELIFAQQRGEALDARLKRHNKDFSRSYERWFKAIYQNKYEYFGEYDLVRLSFLLDLGFYYLGLARQPFLRGSVGLTEPYYSTPPSVPFYYLMRTYNRRFASIARARKARGSAQRTNKGRRFMFKGYTFAPSSSMPIVKALASWAMLELKEGWRSWFQKQQAAITETSTVPAKVAMKPTP